MSARNLPTTSGDSVKDDNSEPRWHVAADGTVLQEWRREDGRSQYGLAQTSRPVTLDELATLDERVITAGQRADRVSNVCMGLALLGLVGGLAAWFVLPAVGVDDVVALSTFGVSALLLVVGVTGVVLAPRRLLAAVAEAYGAAGLESMEVRGVKQDEARVILDAPGTRSAPRRLTR